MSGLDRMKQRMKWEGGGSPHSDGRNVVGKYRTFNSALWNSYQAEWIILNGKKQRCLINPEKQKTDYDDKEISIDYKAGLKNGDVFYWKRTNTHWITFLQRVEEEAYFRAQIRRCDYQLDVNDHKYWIYLRGTVETALVWRQKHLTESNDMNYSMLMYITKNEETLDFFERFKVIKFDGHNWRVSAVDRYTQDGVIEIYVEEYFDNEMEDNMILPEVIEYKAADPHIEGEQIVRAFDTDLIYTVMNYDTTGTFISTSKKVKIVNNNDGSCTIEITTGKSGEFNLEYQIGGVTVLTLPVKIQPL